MGRLPLLPLLLLSSILAAPAPAQDAPAAGEAERLDVFLDCQFGGCYFDFIRTEIGYVNWVRDQSDADVHILVTGSGTGGGGLRYQLEFFGQGSREATRHTLNASLPSGTTENERRDRFARALRLGLVPYLLGTPAADALRVSYDAMDERPLPGELQAARDPWNRWVFELEARTDVEGESGYSRSDVDLSVSAERVTDAWKYELDLFGSRDTRNYELTEGDVETSRHTYQATSLLVKSLNSHWSVGGTVSARTATFANQDLVLRVAPALEYNVFPYAEAQRRQLTLRYSTGLNALDYDEETIYDRRSETVWSQVLQGGLELNQRWGEADISLTGSQFLDDRDLYRLTGWGRVRLRLFRGFSLAASSYYARIQDQISLPKTDLTEEEILLRIREQRTDFRYSTSIGLSYTFGSIYNNIVNPRFEGPRYFD